MSRFERNPGMFPVDEYPPGITEAQFGDRAPELGYLVQLANYLDVVIDESGYGHDLANDLLGHYCTAVAQRDPDMGRDMVTALEWPANGETAGQIAAALRGVLRESFEPLPPKYHGQ